MLNPHHKLILDLMAWSMADGLSAVKLAALTYRVEQLCGFEAIRILPADPEQKRIRPAGNLGIDD